VLSQQYGIQFWLERAYMEICTADDWLSDADGLRLGVSAVLKIGRARRELCAPALLRPDSCSHIAIVRAAFGLAGALERQSSMPPFDPALKTGKTEAKLDNVQPPMPPPDSDLNADSAEVSRRRSVVSVQGLTIFQEAQRQLKLFIESTFGWDGPLSEKKRDLYLPHGTDIEHEALSQAVANARDFVSRAQSGCLAAHEVASKGSVLLETAQRAFEPIKHRYEQTLMPDNLAERFASWLEVCLAFVTVDTDWFSLMQQDELKLCLIKEGRWLEEMRCDHSRTSETLGFTVDMLSNRRHQLEVIISALFGSCPPLPPLSLHGPCPPLPRTQNLLALVVVPCSKQRLYSRDRCRFNLL
jgi:hypothetical protein